MRDEVRATSVTLERKGAIRMGQEIAKWQMDWKRRRVRSIPTLGGQLLHLGPFSPSINRGPRTKSLTMIGAKGYKLLICCHHLERRVTSSSIAWDKFRLFGSKKMSRKADCISFQRGHRLYIRQTWKLLPAVEMDLDH